MGKESLIAFSSGLGDAQSQSGHLMKRKMSCICRKHQVFGHIEQQHSCSHTEAQWDWNWKVSRSSNNADSY